jgi:hypothetical protein
MADGFRRIETMQAGRRILVSMIRRFAFWNDMAEVNTSRLYRLGRTRTGPTLHYLLLEIENMGDKCDLGQTNSLTRLKLTRGVMSIYGQKWLREQSQHNWDRDFGATRNPVPVSLPKRRLKTTRSSVIYFHLRLRYVPLIRSFDIS